MRTSSEVQRLASEVFVGDSLAWQIALVDIAAINKRLPASMGDPFAVLVLLTPEQAGTQQ